MRVSDFGTCGVLRLSFFAIKTSLEFEVPFHGLFRTSMYSENSQFLTGAEASFQYGEYRIIFRQVTTNRKKKAEQKSAPINAIQAEQI